MIKQPGFDSPITAEGLTLVEYGCFHSEAPVFQYDECGNRLRSGKHYPIRRIQCGLRWWIEDIKETPELSLIQCRHGKEFSRPTGYKTHIRLSDF